MDGIGGVDGGIRGAFAGLVYIRYQRDLLLREKEERIGKKLIDGECNKFGNTL